MHSDGDTMGSDLNLDWLISVDDHVIEPAHLWVDRMRAKDREPGTAHGDRGRHGVLGLRREAISEFRALRLRGQVEGRIHPEPVTYAEMRPGCYDPQARLEDMDRAGILASLCFPTVTRFCGQLFMEAGDREFGLVCIRAYNDWMIEEWCGVAPGRYIPLILIPMWDPPAAALEMERCAAKGATAFAFSENPAPLGLPTIHDTDRYWDPVMAAASDLEMVACMHVGSSSQVPQIAPDSPFMANLAWGAMRTSGAMLSWLFSGMFTRFPGLKIALSEGEIGWMPYFLERAEQVLDKQRYWVQRGVQFMEHATTDVDLNTVNIRGLFRGHVFGCFIEDHHGIASIDEIGEDNIMCETDYPHSDSTWPNCITVVKKVIDHLPAETQYKVLRGNAERLYRFTPAAIPGSAHE